jgi:hypothetical protein
MAQSPFTMGAYRDAQRFKRSAPFSREQVAAQDLFTVAASMQPREAAASTGVNAPVVRKHTKHQLGSKKRFCMEVEKPRVFGALLVHINLQMEPYKCN